MMRHSRKLRQSGLETIYLNKLGVSFLTSRKTWSFKKYSALLKVPKISESNRMMWIEMVSRETEGRDEGNNIQLLTTRVFVRRSILLLLEDPNIALALLGNMQFYNTRCSSRHLRNAAMAEQSCGTHLLSCWSEWDLYYAHFQHPHYIFPHRSFLRAGGVLVQDRGFQCEVDSGIDGALR